LVTVACFLPGWAKDLSASPHIGANRNWEYLKEKINDLEMNRKNNHI
jgi:hypothetical protein